MWALSGGELVALAVTLTFASFDWLMSLDPHWFSTIYMCCCSAARVDGAGRADRRARVAQPPSPLDAVTVPAHFHDLGNLMLAFVMLWASSHSHVLIIFSGNLPEEITWYIHRLHQLEVHRAHSRAVPWQSLSCSCSRAGEADPGSDSENRWAFWPRA